MTWLIAIAVVLGIAALLLFGVLSMIVEIFYAPGREPSTTPQIWLLVALGVAALVVSVVLDSVAPGAMAIPWVLWFVALSIIRHSAPLRETEGQRREREAAERKQAEQDRKRAAARAAVAERKRVDSLTRSGLALLEQAEELVGEVKATEAARAGWLGEPADLDFSQDISMISDALLQARRIEKLVERTRKLPDPSPDDIAMLRDAEKSVKTLRAEAKHRFKILQDCLEQARGIDRLLAAERRQQELDEQRADARRRLAAELYGVEVRGPERESDTADAVAARVAAFRELKNVVDDEVRLEIEGGGGNPVAGALTRIRGVLPF